MGSTRKKYFLLQSLHVYWSLYLWSSSSLSSSGQTLFPQVSLVSPGRLSLIPAVGTVVLLLIAFPNFLWCGHLNWGAEKLRTALPIFPCYLSSQCDLRLSNRSSHGRLQNWVNWREKQGVRLPFQKGRSQQRACGSGISSENLALWFCHKW